MMQIREFQQVDVFTNQPYAGNPLAVVLDGTGLSDAQMHQFTRWTNLSEATFLLPPTRVGADYRVRIFCSGGELPFAGHPTLGSCHAWLQAGGKPKGSLIVQECEIGLIPIRQTEDGQLAFAAPPLKRSGPLDESDVAVIARGLGISRADILAHAWCDNGPRWRGVLLASVEQVLAVRPDAQVLAELDVGIIGARGKVGVLAAESAQEDFDFEVRAFFPSTQGMAEDPVTGSLNAGLAQWLIGAGLAPERYIARQGTVLGRHGLVHVARSPDATIWVGGHSVTCIK